MCSFKIKKTLKILKIFSNIVQRLPTTYPKSVLIIHPTLKKLQAYYWESSGTALDPGDPGHSPFAFCDGLDNSVHVSPSIVKETTSNIYWFILHEIGHLLALQKYGEKDYRWEDYKSSEQYANNFADRWCKKFKEEGYLKKV